MQKIEMDFADANDLGIMSEINVTPFIDVMLVLLIIFMVTAPLMMACIPLNLPKGSTGRLDKLEQPLVVSLDLQRRVYVGKEEVKAEDHHSFFQQLALESEDGGVFVRGDKDIPYGEMVELMSKLGKAGFARVILVTEAEKTERNSALVEEKREIVSSSTNVHALDANE